MRPNMARFRAMIVSHMKSFFGALPDPRVERKVDHLLIDVIVISILAVVCGAEGWDEIEDWAREWEPWLRKHLRLRRGIPGRCTYRRVFAVLDPKAFQMCFMAWAASLVGSTNGKVVAFDGKTLRGSFTGPNKSGSLHMVTAWVCENEVIFGLLATDKKSNEITAIPELLELIEIRGATVTLDAMGCQKKIARKILDREGEYVIAVKDNQPKLREEIETAFVTAEIAGELVAPDTVVESKEVGHGRRESRKVSVLDVDGRLDPKLRWPGLRSIAMVESERTVGGKTQCETRYYISSHAANPELLAKCIREHWKIENQQHWTLDTALDEDHCRIRSAHCPENFGTLRRIALNLLKADKTEKKSIRRRRFRASMNPGYLDKILEAIGSQRLASAA